MKAVNRLRVLQQYCLLVVMLVLQEAVLAEAYVPIPQGAYVLFDTHRLYYHCEGDKSPSVIIDGGIGDASANWLPIQAALSPDVRVCIYDRGGYGMSDPGPGPRTTAQIVHELAGLIERAAIPGPYIIIGQSYGGFTAQLFARSYPADTAGIVLVDSSHPQQVSRLAPLDSRSAEKSWLITGREPEAPDHLGVWRKHWYLLNSRRKAVVAQMDELKYFADSARQVAEAGPMPNVPLAVLTRGRSLLPILGNGQSMELEWRAMQQELLGTNPLAWQVIVPNSGHSIHLDAPHAIIEAVLRIKVLAAK